MSLLDSIKKGLMGEGDEYEDQYIDDGPQMVNNNSGVGIGMDEETEEPAEGTSKKNKVKRAQPPSGTARWSTSMPPPSSRWFWSSPSGSRMPAPLPII